MLYFSSIDAVLLAFVSPPSGRFQSVAEITPRLTRSGVYIDDTCNNCLSDSCFLIVPKPSGVFRFHRFVQAFMTFWFGFIALWISMASAAVIVKPTETWCFPLFGFLMLGFGVGLVKLGKWFSRNDADSNPKCITSTCRRRG